ncbi:MAG: polyprenyl synthetase family protein [Proteobacteria bacterium]|nr:polyprenyl synthetase family protein [Pseudomonadota bacterium]
MISSPLPSETLRMASLASFLAPQLAAVNASIFEKMQSPVALIPQIAGYLISLGGKRLRPLLTIASAELCGYEGDRHIRLAACVEFIHTATLLHDDVVDESSLRRGMMSANTKWSNKSSVLVGDFLFSRAFELMIADGSLEVLTILSKASSTIAEGEVIQLTSSHDLGLSEETYLKIISAKTARLFSAATEVGAVVAEAKEAQRQALAHFGHTLGLAFQLMDDVLDYAADQEKLGKRVGDDFRGGKVTLPVIFAYEKGADRAFWQEAFEKGIRDEGALSHAIRLLKESGALLKTKHMAQDFVKEAIGCLDGFPESLLKTALQDLAYFSLHREG